MTDMVENHKLYNIFQTIQEYDHCGLTIGLRAVKTSLTTAADAVNHVSTTKWRFL